MYTIKPYQGFDDVTFGMTSDEIQAKMQRTPERFKKFEFDERETDDYGDFHVHYNESGACEAVEFWDEAPVCYEDVVFFDLTYDETEALFAKMDPDLDIDEEGFTSYKLGIGVYAPDKDEPDAPNEGVIIFEKGYYDQDMSEFATKLEEWRLS